MTTTTPLLRNVALCIPLTVGGAALLDGSHAVAAAASSLLVLANLALMRLIVAGLVRAVATEQSSAFLSGLLVIKFALFTGLLLALTRTFPPIGVVLGFVPMVLGTLLTGVELALRPVDPISDLNEASS